MPSFPVKDSRAVADGRDLRGWLEHVRSWLGNCALPFWSEGGVDGEYGFVEHLTLAGAPADVTYKRLRVQARQVFVFSEASRSGFEPGLSAAGNGWRYMRRHGWLPETGWARALGRRGGIVDPTMDLYDQAFALLAIASWINASADMSALSWADRTLDAMDDRLAPAHGRGWISDTSPDATMLQSPHMHCLEALLALHAATGEARFQARAAELVALFDSTMFDRATNTLTEDFDLQWRRAEHAAGTVVEAGHHYEWVWLLHRAAPIVPGAGEHAAALYGFAERFGSDPSTGLIYDANYSDGSVRTASHRLWPNCEALKAQLARFESSGQLDVARLRQIVDNVFRYFLVGSTPGTWIDQLDASRSAYGETIPTSSLYHVYTAFSELLRLEPALAAAGVLEC